VSQEGLWSEACAPGGRKSANKFIKLKKWSEKVQIFLLYKNLQQQSTVQSFETLAEKQIFHKNKKF
jgi:hypothetical protein